MSEKLKTAKVKKEVAPKAKVEKPAAVKAVKKPAEKEVKEEKKVEKIEEPKESPRKTEVVKETIKPASAKNSVEVKSEMEPPTGGDPKKKRKDGEYIDSNVILVPLPADGKRVALHFVNEV